MNKLSLMLLLLMCCHAFASENTGVLRGSVIDAETKDPIIGANVILLGTRIGAATGLNGEFEISDVLAGVYSVKVGVVEHHPVVLDSVVISPDIATELHLVLQVNEHEYDDVVLATHKMPVYRGAVRILTQFHQYRGILYPISMDSMTAIPADSTRNPTRLFDDSSED